MKQQDTLGCIDWHKADLLEREEDRDNLAPFADKAMHKQQIAPDIQDLGRCVNGNTRAPKSEKPTSAPLLSGDGSRPDQVVRDRLIDCLVPPEVAMPLSGRRICPLMAKGGWIAEGLV
jgi:hypothetical protein